jgi:hypothetical protein
MEPLLNASIISNNNLHLSRSNCFLHWAACSFHDFKPSRLSTFLTFICNIGRDRTLTVRPVRVRIQPVAGIRLNSKQTRFSASKVVCAVSRVSREEGAGDTKRVTFSRPN